MSTSIFISVSARRLCNLYAGLVLFGVSIAFFVQARLGLDPWDVLHQGISERTGVRIGTVAIAVGVIVLLLWIPLRQRPGLGTLSNVLLVGLTLDVVLVVLPEPGAMPFRFLFLVVAIVLNAVATGLYIGAGLGPGPRDGLMTGLAARGHSVRVVRTAIELTVLAVGWLLGGTIGVGTALFALTIGPLVHVLLPRLTIRETVAA
jgi:uncharacterized membrane protein YczE